PRTQQQSCQGVVLLREVLRKGGLSPHGSPWQYAVVPRGGAFLKGSYARWCSEDAHRMAWSVAHVAVRLFPLLILTHSRLCSFCAVVLVPPALRSMDAATVMPRDDASKKGAVRGRMLSTWLAMAMQMRTAWLGAWLTWLYVMSRDGASKKGAVRGRMLTTWLAMAIHSSHAKGWCFSERWRARLRPNNQQVADDEVQRGRRGRVQHDRVLACESWGLEAEGGGGAEGGGEEARSE
ncbi:unnamed protein product, partial [Closterium sp. NIES-54]